MGITAFWFIQIATIARSKAQHNWKMIGSCVLNFLMIGCLAVYFPSLLVNGKSPAQMEFANFVSIGLSALLLVLRCVVT
ncbi:hypothetical protein LDG_7959 [Legionella drancourtii LLAP12]|uniref:Uncharacterized protein n=1 Tax=Legionella drancourtii LLAP12 TaxID=658187 RepID=G9ERP2_9GAMM|nr:hypothetical protein LDG_7959 [Legionella drancourtii LLAP12]